MTGAIDGSSHLDIVHFHARGKTVLTELSLAPETPSLKSSPFTLFSSDLASLTLTKRRIEILIKQENPKQLCTYRQG